MDVRKKYKNWQAMCKACKSEYEKKNNRKIGKIDKAIYCDNCESKWDWVNENV
jgi:hydrogenase maturation factor HypF (carbamoyltransferase family)